MRFKIPEQNPPRLASKDHGHLKHGLTRRETIALGVSATLTMATGMAKIPTRQFTADYVIVGAGSAGCVLARRLTEAGASVILLEAGGQDDLPEIQNPLAWPALQGTAIDWQYQTTPQSNTLNRQHAWARGKVLGGSGSINAMAHHRGHPSVYDSWEKLFGAKGWSFDELLPYFRKLETFSGGASDYHGGDGPIYVDVPREGFQHPVAQQFIEASIASGYPPTDDINGPQMEGPTWNHVAIKDQQRQSPSLCYLQPALASPNPPTLLTGALATELIFDGMRCIGVQYNHEGTEKKVFAEREVLLCAGSLGSPKLLSLSGIGDPAQLLKHDITTRAPLPGVGQNLQDHLLGAGAVYEAKQPLPVSQYQHGEAMQYLHTESGLAGPDLLLMFVTVPFASSAFPQPPANAYTILPCIMQPESRGAISLRSANPEDAIVINPNYFAQPKDALTMLRGFEVARAIGGHSSFNTWRAGEIYPGSFWGDDISKDEFVRKASNTFFHPVGTCAMGDQPESVVDSSLRVRGLDGLRVVDASVIPSIPNAPTHAPVLAIAERAADLILDLSVLERSDKSSA